MTRSVVVKARVPGTSRDPVWKHNTLEACWMFSMSENWGCLKMVILMKIDDKPSNFGVP